MEVVYALTSLTRHQAHVVGMSVLSHLLRAGTGTATAGNATFGDLVGNPGRLVTELTLTGTYPALSWLAYLCVGMAAGRALLSSRRVVATMALVGVTLAPAGSPRHARLPRRERSSTA